MKALIDHPAFNIAIFALLLSLPWEFGQMWLYAGTSGMSNLEGIQICMVATLGDALIALFAFAVVAALSQSPARVRTPKRSQVAGFVATGLVVPLLVLWFARRQIAGSMNMPGAAARLRAPPAA